MPDTFAATVQLTVIAMGVVFGVLMVLGLLITLSKMVLAGAEPKSQPQAELAGTEEPVVEDDHEETEGDVEEQDLPEETVAVITAAVYAYMGASGRRRPGVSSSQANPWLTAGRQRLMSTRRMGTR